MKVLDRISEAFRVGRRFAPQLAEHRRSLTVVTAGFLGVAVLEVLRPWPLKWIFDRALEPVGSVASDPRRVVLLSALAFLLIVAVKAGLEYFARIRLAQAGHAVTRGLRYRIFEHLAHLSPTFHARHKTGDLLVRLMGDVPMLRTMIVDSMVEVIARGLLIVGTIGVMLALDPVMTLAVLALAPVVAVLLKVFSRHITIAVRKQRRKEGALADYLHEAIAAAPVIQSLGRSGHAVRRFARSNRTSVRAGLKAARLAARMGSTVELALGLAMAVTLAFGGLRVLDEALTPGELLVFLSYVRSLMKPVRSASKHGERIAKGTACGERVLAVLDERVAVESPPGAPRAPARPAELAFDDVHFSYAAEKDALHGLTVAFRRGELTALVGASGSGKSTLAALAVRLHDPDRGAVRLDGRDVRSMDLASLRDCFGVALQDAVLFGESVRENLLLGDPEASEEDLRRALRAAAADGFVAELPEELDTVLGSSGAGLSGGQRQRLALARTLLRDPPILIVDEPFAGLDRAAVSVVHATLVELARERIVIVIAHDLEDLDALDHIVFLERGRLGGEGSHGELGARLPGYREMVRTFAGERS